MAGRAILHWPDPRLSQKAPVVSDLAAGAALGRELLEIMYAAPGRGLAAPQVGVLERVFVMDLTWKEGVFAPFICINPQLSEQSDEVAFGPEGCLSLPGLSLEIPRARSVTLTWIDEYGEPRQARLEGIAAICAQHEYDHLDGIMTLDRLSASERARAEKDYVFK